MNRRAYFHLFLVLFALVGVALSCTTVDSIGGDNDNATESDGSADSDTSPDGSDADIENQAANENGNDNTDAPSDADTPGGGEDEAANDNANDNSDPPIDRGTTGDGDVVIPPVDDCGNNVGNGDEIVSGPAATEPPIDNDTVFRSLVVDPANPNVVFCGSERNGFLKSTDGGASWVRQRNGLRHSESPENYPEIWNVAFSPADSNTLLAATTDSAGPVIGDVPSAMAGIYKTADGGQTWRRSNCGLDNSKIAYVLFSPADASVALAAVQGEAASFGQAAGEYFGGGIYRSGDGGEHWSLATMPAGAEEKNRYWIIRAAGSPAIYFTFGFNFDDSSINVGFLKSSDEGQTWIAFAPELRSRTITHFDVSSDGQTIYALPEGSFLFERSTDAGQTWQSLPNVSPGPQGPIAICPTDSQTVLFTSTTDLRRTADGMQTDVVVQTSAAQFEWIAFAPSDTDVVYAATQGYDVYKSTDNGVTFNHMANLRDEINSLP